MHLLAQVHPALCIADLINNLKTASSRRIRSQYAQHLDAFYNKPVFWHRAYFVSSVGGATLETVKAYVQSQGTKEQPHKRPHNLRNGK